MKRLPVLLFLLFVLHILGNAQFTLTNSSFSNGSMKGSDGTFTLNSLLGSTGFLQDVEYPTLPASNITFSNVTNNSMTISFTPGNGEKRVVLMEELIKVPSGGPAPAPTPGPAPAAGNGQVSIADGTELSGNSNFALATEYQPGWKVIFVGSNSSLQVTGLHGDHVYMVTVIEYNGSGSGTRYLNLLPPFANQVTLPDLLAPSIAASNITFTNILSTSLKVNFLAGNGGQRLAVMKAGSAPISQPVDDLFYSGDLSNAETVVFNGNGSSFDLTGLEANTQYFISIFEYNTDGIHSRYLLGSAPVASQTTLALPIVYVTTPPDAAVNQNTALNVTSKAVTGATAYTIELSSDPAFANAKVLTGGRTLNFDSLRYGTVYYTRVKTDLRPDYGKQTTFITKTAESISYVTTPANNAVNISTTPTVSSNNVLYANSYTIQLSETADFNVIAFEKTGGTRTLTFTGLKYNTTYYNRVLTDLSTEYGSVRSFTTRTPESLAYVTSPANGAVDRNSGLSITSNNVPGAMQYTIQLSENTDFSVIAFEVSGPTRTLAFSGLKYNTTYYNRVLTDLTTIYGQVRSFTTRKPESIAYVTSPADNSVNINTVLNISSFNVAGAFLYTIQLSESPDFSTIDFEVTGSTRTLAFSGLKYNKTYYNRVLTDLTTEYGEVRSFTTRKAESNAYVTSPGNNSVDINTMLNISSNNVPGASLYTVQLSESPDFSTIDFEVTGSTRTLSFSGLKYNKTYYNRVLTDLTTEYGEVRNFTTRTAESITYVTSPADNEVNVNNVSLNITSNNVPGASQYNIQLSELSDFTAIQAEVSGPNRTLAFSGLKYNTRYYNRVSTDLTTLYGLVRSFTTRTAESLAYVTSPSNKAVNVNTSLNISSNTVPMATQYTIQLSEKGDFSSIDIEKTGFSRTLAFTGLKSGTLYYTRVLTNITSEFGSILSFTTGGTPPLFATNNAIVANSNSNTIAPSVENANLQIKAISLYPNPASDLITISALSSFAKSKAIKILISDIYGKILLMKTIENSATTETIDIKSFTNGIYFINIQTDTEKIVKRFVKL